RCDRQALPRSSPDPPPHQAGARHVARMTPANAGGNAGLPPDIALRAHPGYTLGRKQRQGRNRMTQLTRRSLIAGTASAALATIPAGSPAHAAAPAADKQAPGFYRYKVGSFEITVVTDGANRFPLPDDFVANIKKDEVQAALSA